MGQIMSNHETLQSEHTRLLMERTSQIEVVMFELAGTIKEGRDYSHRQEGETHHVVKLLSSRININHARTSTIHSFSFNKLTITSSYDEHQQEKLLLYSSFQLSKKTGTACSSWFKYISRSANCNGSIRGNLCTSRKVW